MINFNFLVKRARVINEANLFNKEDLTSAVLREIHGESEAIQRWFKQKYITWYQTPDGDSSKHLQDYNWKEGDPNWAKPNPDHLLSNYKEQYSFQNHLLGYYTKERISA